MDHKYKPEELFLEEYNYDDWSDTKKKKSDKEKSSNEKSTDLLPIPPLECDEEEK